MGTFIVGMMALLWLAAAAPGHAQSLATGPDNNGSGGVFMNLQAVQGPVDIIGFDATVAGEPGPQVSVEVWVRSGSYAGFTSSNAGWTLSQTVTGLSQGVNARTPFALATPIVVSPSGITAVYLHSITASAGLRYSGTLAAPAQTTFTNNDLGLFSDTARTGNVAFAGGQNTGRAFSGVIRYRNSLETAANNNGSGGIFLNLQSVGPGVMVKGFEVPLGPAAGTQVTIEVWTRPGSYVGFTASNTGWTLSETVVATSAGSVTPAPLTLARSIPISAAQPTGIYLHAILPAATGSGIRYTGGASVPQTTWSNSDLVLFSDTARTGFTPFAGTQSSPRTFSGRVVYTKDFGTAAADNGSGGVFLQLQPVGGRLDLTGFDVPMSSGAGIPAAVEVWTRPGSYAGFTGSSMGWTLTQTVTGLTQGSEEETPFLLITPIPLPTGAPTSVYLHSIVVETGIRYTGTGVLPPQTTWSNNDLVLFSNIARTGNLPFAGSENSPRVFSGTLRYTDRLFANGFDQL